VGAIRPHDGFLEKARALTAAHGVVLVFDELFTGFRWSLGGAQEYFGVTPDLACFGKAIANGMPVSCVCGSREIMERFDRVFYSGTYLAETLSLVAVLATIDKLRTHDVHRHVAELGQYMIDRFEALIAKHELGDTLSIIGYPFKSVINFRDGDRHDSLELKTFFQQECAKRGVLFIGYHLVSLSHTREHVDFTLDAYDEIMALTAAILARGEAVREHLVGSVITPVFKDVGDRSSYDEVRR